MDFNNNIWFMNGLLFMFIGNTNLWDIDIIQEDLLYFLLIVIGFIQIGFVYINYKGYREISDKTVEN